MHASAPQGRVFLSLLIRAFEAIYACCSVGIVLCSAPFDTLAPHVKRTAFHVLAHDRADLIFFQSVLHLDRFKRRPVFPGHLDDAVNGFWSKVQSFVC